LIPGANTITVVAKDTFNNATTKQATITYNPPDTDPPSLVIDFPPPGGSITTSA
jgi:hypothetical protein